MNFRSRKLLLASAAALALALAGCGVPEELRLLAQDTDAQIAVRSQEVDAARQAFAAFQSSEESVGFRAAIEREGWSERLSEAEGTVAQARKMFDERVQPVMEADDADRSEDAYQALLAIPKLLGSARQDVNFWRTRREALTEAKQNADSVVQQARSRVKEVQASLASLRSRAASTKREFSEQSETIDELVSPLTDAASGAGDSLEKLEAQYRMHRSEDVADYGVMATESQSIAQTHEKIAQGSAAAEAKLAELSRSYAKTLVDMRADYALIIRRQSWDNSVDYPALHDYDYPQIDVDGPTFDHFDSIATSLATYKRGWFSDDVNLFPGVAPKRWESLKIDPEQAWPSSDDDEAELWLQTATAKYFHKYHVVENGETSETDWVPVDEAFFFANVDNIGMDVEAKPYGVFEENKLTHAAPPGMAYVGNERYGRWERRDGGMVWTWIAPYLFYRTLFGNPWRYSRNEWNTWHTGYYGSRPYYGGSASSPAYGTRSSRTQTSPTLSSSNFGRSGGFNRPTGSVRGAGPASRGGGFGGSGK